MKTRVIQHETVQHVTSDADGRADVATSDGRETQRNGKRLSALIRRHPLAAFLVIAFALTWVTVPLGSFMAAGPLIAALVVIGFADGRAGMRELCKRMLHWRVGWRWYAAALLIPLGLALAAGALNVALGASDAAFARLQLSALAMTFGLRMVVPMFAPLGEEPAWRGFALPRFQAKHSPFTATLVLGLIVAIWHVPLVFLSTEHFAPIFLLATFAVTFFYTWIFNHTGGSVFMTVLAHAAEGVIVGEFVGKHGFAGVNETRFAVLYTIGWCAVAVTLVIFDRAAWRKPAKRSTETSELAQA